jgi:hypothetical protein
LLGLLAALLLISAVIAADASAAWTPPIPVSDVGVVGRTPRVEVDAAFNATVVWESGNSPNRSIRSAFRPAGGPWQSPTSLIAAGSDCHDPELAVNPGGAAVVVADCGSGATAMSAAYRPAGGAWGSAVTVTGSGSGIDPRVDIDDDGNSVAVWETSTNTVQSAYRPAAGPWAAGGLVSPAADVALDPDVAISRTGRALATWRHDVSPSNPVFTVETTSRQDAGPWGATPQVLTPPATSTLPVVEYEPRVTWNRTGGRLAVWSNTTTPSFPVLQSEWGSAGDFGSWGGDALVQSSSDGVRTVEEPQVALDDQGRAVAVWRSVNSGGQFRTQAATTSFINDNWTMPVTLGTTEIGGPARPAVAIDPAGDSTIVWRDLSGTAFAVSRPPGGAFGPPVPLASTSFGNPRVTMDTAGDALATWDDQGSTPARVVVTVNDVTPPALSLDGPSAAATGSPIALSATATDVWSSPVTLSWDLGDGSTATGSSVSHAYGSAGTETVTVTATDGAGNTATRSLQITVKRPGGLGPVDLGVSVPKQSWRKIRRAHGVKLRCTLDAIGECQATASVSGRVARRLGLKAGKGSRALSLGTGRVAVTAAGRATALKVKLSRDARTAISRADQSVPLKLSVKGTAPGRASASLKRKLVIRR